MTTFEQAAVSLTRGVASRLEARAQRRTQRGTRTRTLAPTLRRLTLTVGALGAFTYAASTFAVWTGCVVGGLCALYLEQSLSDD